jgi:hypothetical protein
VDLEVPRSSRGGGTSHFNGLDGQSELIASQKPDWEAYGKLRRDFSGAALRISSSSPATREDAAALMRLNPDKHSYDCLLVGASRNVRFLGLAVPGPVISAHLRSL